MRPSSRPYIRIGAAVAAIVLAAFLQGCGGGGTRESGFISPEDLGRIAEIDRSLPQAAGEGGSEAFRETFEAGAGNSITFEIPPGMAIDVTWELQGGSVQLLLDPSWEDPGIVELGEGASTRRLITNGGEGPGRINIRSTPIGDVQGSFTLFAE